MSSKQDIAGQRFFLKEEDFVEELRLLKESQPVSVSSLPPRSVRHGSKYKNSAPADSSVGVFAAVLGKKRKQQSSSKQSTGTGETDLLNHLHSQGASVLNVNSPLTFHEKLQEDAQEVQRVDADSPGEHKSKLKRITTQVLSYVIGVPCFIALVFWSKFVLVYNIPDFVKTSPAADGAYAYICYKSWTFGPPLFSLKDMLSTADKQDLKELKSNLGDYKEIVDKPIWVVYRFKK